MPNAAKNPPAVLSDAAAQSLSVNLSVSQSLFVRLSLSVNLSSVLPVEDDCCKRNVCPPTGVVTPRVDPIKGEGYAEYRNGYWWRFDPPGTYRGCEIRFLATVQIFLDQVDGICYAEC